MTESDHLRNRIDSAAQDLVQALPDPGAWENWLLYLMEVLDGEAQESGLREEYEAMLDSMWKSLEARVSQGSWWAGVTGMLKQKNGESKGSV